MTQNYDADELSTLTNRKKQKEKELKEIEEQIKEFSTNMTTNKNMFFILSESYINKKLENKLKVTFWIGVLLLTLFIGAIQFRTCGENYYKGIIFCHKATNCKRNQFEIQKPQGYKNRVCKAISECKNDEFQFKEPSQTSDRQCKAVLKCKENEKFEIKPPTATSDRICGDITLCNEKQYVFRESTKKSNRICKTKCDRHQYQVKKATLKKDTICKPLRICKNDEFELSPPKRNENHYEKNRKCQKVKICHPDFEYVLKEPTKTSDRICKSNSKEKKTILKLLTKGDLDKTSEFLQKIPNKNLHRFLSANIETFVLNISKKNLKNIQNKMRDKQFTSKDIQFYHTCLNKYPKLKERKKFGYSSFMKEIVELASKIGTYFETLKAELSTKLEKSNDFQIILEDYKHIRQSFKDFKPFFKLSKRMKNYPKISHVLKVIKKYLRSSIKKIEKLDLENMKFQSDQQKMFSDYFIEVEKVRTLSNISNSIHEKISSKLDSFLNNLNQKFITFHHSSEEILENPRAKKSDGLIFQRKLETLKFIEHYCATKVYLNCKQVKCQNLLENVYHKVEKLLVKEKESLINDLVPKLLQAHLYNYFFKNDKNEFIHDKISKFLNKIKPDGINKISKEIKKLQVKKIDQTDGIGNDFLNSYKQFLFITRRKRANKMSQRDIQHIFDELKGTNVQKYGVDYGYVFNPKLMKFYREYENEYNKLIGFDESEETDDLLQKVKDILDLVQESIKNCKQNDSSFFYKKECIPKLVARVSSLWTLSDAISEKAPLREGYLLEPHAAQIITIFRLLCIDETNLQSNLAQVSTGEGKSIILAITASVLSLLGSDVSVVCYSTYLRNRDYNDFKKFYNLLNIDVKYHTFDTLTEAIINEKVDVRLFIEEYFISKNFPNVKKLTTSKIPILMIDEVDVFFQKRFYGNTYNPIATIKHNSIYQLITKIWKEKINDIKKIEKLREYQNVLKNFNSNWNAVFESAFYKISEDMNHIKNHNYEKSEDGRVGYVDIDRINWNHYELYLTMLAYLKESDNNPTVFNNTRNELALKLSVGSFSYSEIPKEFKYIMGVSGTLQMMESENKILKSYGIERNTIIPSMYPKGKLSFSSRDPVYFKIVEEVDFMPTLVKKILRVLKNGKTSVIIVCKDDKHAEKIFHDPKFKSFKDKTMLVTERNSEDNKLFKMTKRTSAGDITIITRHFGRGSDFQSLDPRVNKNGGVQVITTFFSEDPSEEIQLKGRTARQSEDGAFYFILKEEDLIAYGANKKDIDDCKEKNNCYQFLSEHRNRAHLQTCKAKETIAQQLLQEHKDSLNFLQDIYAKNSNNLEKFITNINNHKPKQVLKPSQKSKPSHIVLAVDASGSMLGQKWSSLKGSLHHLLHQRIKDKGINDRVSVIVYDHEVQTVIEGLIEELSRKLKSSLDYTGGGTNFIPPLTKAHELFSKSDANHFDFNFLFLTDGHSFDDGLEHMKRLCDDFKSEGNGGLLTHLISFGEDADIGKFKDMAHVCGDSAKFVHSVDGMSLTRAFEEFSVNLDRNRIYSN